MTVNEASRQYQACLEAARTHPDFDELLNELDDAYRIMVNAWLEHCYAKPEWLRKEKIDGK